MFVYEWSCSTKLATFWVLPWYLPSLKKHVLKRKVQYTIIMQQYCNLLPQQDQTEAGRKISSLYTEQQKKRRDFKSST